MENDLVKQQNEEAKIEKFGIFAERNAKTTEDYARIFAELATNYDRINEQDFTGMKSSAKAMKVNKMSRRENLDVEYIDFSISSQLIEVKEGKWIAYPKMKKGKVIALMIAYVNADETKVGYREMNETTDFYRHFSEDFQKAFDKKKNKSKVSKGGESEPHCINTRTGEYIPFDDWRCQAVLERDYTSNISIVELTYFNNRHKNDNTYLGWNSSYNPLILPPDSNNHWGIEDYCSSFGSCATNNSGGYFDIQYTGNNNPPTPCSKIREKQKQGAGYSNVFNNLNKENVFNLNYEVGYYERGDNGFMRISGKEGTSHLDLPDDKTNIYGLLHTHNNKDGVIKIFSPVDVRTFINEFLKNAKSFKGSYTDAYSTVVTSEGSYTLKFSKEIHPGGVNYETLKDWENWYREEMEFARNDDGTTFDQEKVERVFMRFITEKVKIDGLEVYKTTQQNSSKMNYNKNNNNSIIIDTPC